MSLQFHCAAIIQVGLESHGSFLLNSLIRAYVFKLSPLEEEKFSFRILIVTYMNPLPQHHKTCSPQKLKLRFIRNDENKLFPIFQSHDNSRPTRIYLSTNSISFLILQSKDHLMTLAINHTFYSLLILTLSSIHQVIICL